MRPQLRLGSVAAIPIGMNLGAAVVITLLAAGLAFGRFPQQYPGRPAVAYLAAGAVAAALFIASVLAHELAHALVARAHGVRVDRITLWLLGGVAQLRGALRSPSAELAVAVVGPATSFGLGVGFAILAGIMSLAGLDGLPRAVVGYLAATNLMLSVFNLIPAAPLDGGRVLRAALWWRTGDPARAAKVAGTAGRWLGIAAVVGGVWLLLTGAGLDGLWLVLLGGFIAAAAAAEEHTAALGQRLAGLRVADVMTANPVTAVPSAWLGPFIDRTVLTRPFSTYPLVDLDGRLAGLVTLARIRQIPAEQRTWTRLGDIACPAEQVPTARADEPLADLLPRIDEGETGGRAVVVDEHNHVIGVVSPVDIARAATLADLRTTPPAGTVHGGESTRPETPTPA